MVRIDWWPARWLESDSSIQMKVISPLLSEADISRSFRWGRDVAQLVEHRTGTPPTQVRFPGAARDFSPRVNFQCRLSYGVRTPVRNCMHFHLRARQRSRSPRQSSVDYRNTETASMNPRLGGAYLSQLAFPGESNPDFS